MKGLPGGGSCPPPRLSPSPAQQPPRGGRFPPRAAGRRVPRRRRFPRGPPPTSPEELEGRSVPPPTLPEELPESERPPRPERRKWRKGGWTGCGKRGAGPRGGKREGSLAIGSNAESVVEYVARTHDLRMTQTRLQRRGREVASLSRRGIRRVIDFPFANFRPEFVYETGATTNCANSTH